MGRYHAPKVDDEDDGEGIIPMDIDDDNDECYVSEDLQSLAWRNEATHITTIAQHVPNVGLDNNIWRDGISQCLLDHNKNKMKRARAMRLKITVAAVAIISIVLKRYAPPPPPILNQSPFNPSSLSTDYTIDTSTVFYSYRDSTDLSNNDNMPSLIGVAQHENWSSYSRHLISYVSSVAWYSLSNSFRYAWDEIRDGYSYIACWHDCFDARNETLFLTRPKMKELFSRIALLFSHMMQSLSNSRAMTDMQHGHNDYIKHDQISERLFSMPAAHGYRKILSPRRSTNCLVNTVDTWSTEEYLRQTIGTSLSPQNLALKIISERIDAWGLVSNSNDSCIDEDTISRWMLPPAIGFLLVGPAGVGKLRTARRLAHYLLAGNCSDITASGSGVLETLVEAGDLERSQSITEKIVNHLNSRDGLGSVIIIHHIESMPMQTISDILDVLSGKHHSLSYQASIDAVEASCNGTVFVMTSRQFGTNSIFQVIKQNGGLNRMSKESLVESIRRDVDDADLGYSSMLASHTTIAPFLPFQQEDLLGILHGRVQTLNLRYQGVHWSRLQVSLAAIRYFVGSDKIEYSDFLAIHDMSGYMEENDTTDTDVSSFTFSTRGAHALDQNPLLELIQSISTTGTRSRPGAILKIGVDDLTKETILRWCSNTNGLESCDVEW